MGRKTILSIQVIVVLYLLTIKAPPTNISWEGSYRLEYNFLQKDGTEINNLKKYSSKVWKSK